MRLEVRNRHVVIAGAGRSGLAAVDLLLAHGARVTLSDVAAPDEARDLRDRGVAVDVGPHAPALFAGADLVVLSPGVSIDEPAVRAAREAGVAVIGELELASRFVAGRIIAITGTKGKSTTTTLTARILQEAGFDAPAGGNIGTALSAQVAASTPDTLHVVEASSFQLEATDSFHPWIAVLVNLSPDHLDRHPTFQAYAAAKARIFANQTARDWAVVNADDAASVELARDAKARRFDFALTAGGLSSGVTVSGDDIVRRESGRAVPLLPVGAVRLPGRHLLEDVLAAVAVGCAAGAPPQAMLRAIERFSGLPHALETVAEQGGVRFVNDSKATNIASAAKSLASFDAGIVAIMGGRFKGGDFRDLRELVAARVDAIVAIGESAPLIEDALGDLAPVRRAASMREAVGAAADEASPGGVVLLAPACSSFDMFRDYIDRGDQFRAAVHELVR